MKRTTTFEALKARTLADEALWSAETCRRFPAGRLVSRLVGTSPAVRKHRRVGALQITFGLFLSLGSFLTALPSRAAVVYESPSEFYSSGDFNGDSILDVIVLDKLTGNARVGYQDSIGGLHWSQPLVTGVENTAGFAVGRFLQTGRDAVAVTAPDFNRINLVDLSGTNTAGTPVVVTPIGIGPHGLAALANPLGGASPAFNYLLSASSLNNASAERLDLLSINAGVGTPAGNFSESGSFDRGNPVQLLVTTATFAVGMARGTNDTLQIWQFTNLPNVLVALSNLPRGSDYAFGRFNGETLPRFVVYQPGGTNVTVVPLTLTAGKYSFGSAVSVALAEAVQRVYYVDLGTDGTAMVQFSDGVQGLRMPGGSPLLASVYRSGTGSTGNVFTGVAPLSNGNFALIDGPAGSSASTHAQVVHFDGGNYTQVSSGNLPTVSSRSTRANLWLFQLEPFVNNSPGFIASLNAADWSDVVSGLPLTLSVSKEIDNGSSSGLGNTVTNNLGAPPTGSAFGLPDQYRDMISLFSYAAPHAAEPVVVNISPPPGHYSGRIQVSFTTLNINDKVFYKIGPPDSWHPYTATFPLTNDATIQFYGTNAASLTRSRVQFASYFVGHDATPTPLLNLTNGTSTTNPPQPIVVNTNLFQPSTVGTVFYGRRSANNNYTVWSINLDGSGETFVTTGARPRVSRDGHYLAVIRGGTPLLTQGNLWIRNLFTGEESLLYSNLNYTIGYDWDLTATNLVFDNNCWLWKISPGSGGIATLLPLLNPDCYDDAPVVNPVDGRLAFHNLNPSTATNGLYITSVDLKTRTNLHLNVSGPSWPAWSADGQWLALADGNSPTTAFTADNGVNLWVTRTDGTVLYPISEFADGINRFPHGAIWSPDDTALVSAGTIFGTNGLWLIPLVPDKSHCDGFPILLPTSLGDAVDFAGSIVVAQPPPDVPRLRIRIDPGTVVVYWSTNFNGYILESTLALAPPSNWQAVNGFIAVAGNNYEYREPLPSLAPKKFFRLHLATAPARPQLLIHLEGNTVVLDWKTSFPGFTLQSAANVPPLGNWTNINGPYPTAGPYFEVREAVSPSRRFYRLQGP